MWFYDQPGFVRDFRNPARWDLEMTQEAEGIVLDLAREVAGNSLTQAQFDALVSELGYVNPKSEEPPADAETIPIQGWGGFPRAVDRAIWNFNPIVLGDGTVIDSSGVLRAAEDLGDDDHRPGVFVDRFDRRLELPVRHRQDEYLEWFAERDDTGRLTKVAFVAEGYDYFSALFEDDPKRVAEIFQEFCQDGSISPDELRSRDGVWRRTSRGQRYAVVKPGGYNVRNRFNIMNGIVHLSHRANSLGAEVNLAGVSGLARNRGDGSLLKARPDERGELFLCCSGGGLPNRNSDPAIARQAYGLILGGYRYTLANPVGLYIVGKPEPGASGFVTRGGEPVPAEWWNVIRGDEGSKRILRLELTVPPGEGTISDLQIGGVPVVFPGQLARLLRVHLFVTRWKREVDGVGPRVPCRATCCGAPADPNSSLTLSAAPCAEGRTVFDDLLPAPGDELPHEGPETRTMEFAHLAKATMNDIPGGRV